MPHLHMYISFLQKKKQKQQHNISKSTGTDLNHGPFINSYPFYLLHFVIRGEKKKHACHVTPGLLRKRREKSRVRVKNKLPTFYCGGK